MLTFKKTNSKIKRFLNLIISVAFLINMILPDIGFAQALHLPAPGTMLMLTPAFAPPIIKGLEINPSDPFQFNFFVNSGENNLEGEVLKTEAERMIKYFLASLTIPEEDLWVNLSPYEEDRIIEQTLSFTDLGRDLLAEDYLLKQIMASVLYPEDELGSAFWQKVYQKAYQKYGTTEIPVDTFHKVWILPDKAVVYETGNRVFVAEASLKVMLEQDYLALQQNQNSLISEKDNETSAMSHELYSQILRDIVIPEITREVNEGRHFAQLRQIYNSLILANWYKDALRESILGRLYVDQRKVDGIALDPGVQDQGHVQEIYNQYLEAFRTGVYNYIRVEYDASSQRNVPRKYFSGGLVLQTDLEKTPQLNPRQAGNLEGPDGSNTWEFNTRTDINRERRHDSAMAELSEFQFPRWMPGYAIEILRQEEDGRVGIRLERPGQPSLEDSVFRTSLDFLIGWFKNAQESIKESQEESLNQLQEQAINRVNNFVQNSMPRGQPSLEERGRRQGLQYDSAMIAFPLMKGITPDQAVQEIIKSVQAQQEFSNIQAERIEARLGSYAGGINPSFQPLNNIPPTVQSYIEEIRIIFGQGLAAFVSKAQDLWKVDHLIQGNNYFEVQNTQEPSIDIPIVSLPTNALFNKRTLAKGLAPIEQAVGSPIVMNEIQVLVPSARRGKDDLGLSIDHVSPQDMSLASGLILTFQDRSTLLMRGNFSGLFSSLFAENFSDPSGNVFSVRSFNPQKDQAMKTTTTYLQSYQKMVDTVRGVLPGAVFAPAFTTRRRDSRQDLTDPDSPRDMLLDTVIDGMAVTVEIPAPRPEDLEQFSGLGLDLMYIPVVIERSETSSELQSLMDQNKDGKTLSAAFVAYLEEKLSDQLSLEMKTKVRTHKVSGVDTIQFVAGEATALPSEDAILAWLPFFIERNDNAIHALNQMFAQEIESKRDAGNQLYASQRQEAALWWHQLAQERFQKGEPAIDILIDNTHWFFSEFIKGDDRSADLLITLLNAIDVNTLFNPGAYDLKYDEVAGRLISQKDLEAKIPGYGKNLENFLSEVNRVNLLVRYLDQTLMPKIQDGQRMAIEHPALMDAAASLHYRLYRHLLELGDYKEYDPLRITLGAFNTKLNQAIRDEDSFGINFKSASEIINFFAIKGIDLNEQEKRRIENLLSEYESENYLWAFTVLELAEVLDHETFVKSFRLVNALIPRQVLPSQKPNPVFKGGAGRINSMTFMGRLALDLNMLDQDPGYVGQFSIQTRRLRAETVEGKFEAARDIVEKMFNDPVAKSSEELSLNGVHLSELLEQGRIELVPHAQRAVAKMDYIVDIPIEVVYPVDIKLDGKLVATVAVTETVVFKEEMAESKNQERAMQNLKEADFVPEGKAKMDNIPDPLLVVINGETIFYGDISDGGPGGVYVGDGIAHLDKGKEATAPLMWDLYGIWKYEGIGTEDIGGAAQELERMVDLARQFDRRTQGRPAIVDSEQIYKKLVMANGGAWHFSGPNIDKLPFVKSGGVLFFSPTSCSTTGAIYGLQSELAFFGLGWKTIAKNMVTFHGYTGSDTSKGEPFGHLRPGPTGAGAGVNQHFIGQFHATAARTPTAWRDGQSIIMGGSIYNQLIRFPETVDPEVMMAWYQRYAQGNPSSVKVFDTPDEQGRFTWKETIGGQDTGSIIIGGLIPLYGNYYLLPVGYDNEKGFSHENNILHQTLAEASVRQDETERRMRAIKADFAMAAATEEFSQHAQRISFTEPFNPHLFVAQFGNLLSELRSNDPKEYSRDYDLYLFDFPMQSSLQDGESVDIYILEERFRTSYWVSIKKAGDGLDLATFIYRGETQEPTFSPAGQRIVVSALDKFHEKLENNDFAMVATDAERLVQAQMGVEGVKNLSQDLALENVVNLIGEPLKVITQEDGLTLYYQTFKMFVDRISDTDDWTIEFEEIIPSLALEDFGLENFSSKIESETIVQTIAKAVDEPKKEVVASDDYVIIEFHGGDVISVRKGTMHWEDVGVDYAMSAHAMSFAGELSASTVLRHLLDVLDQHQKEIGIQELEDMKLTGVGEGELMRNLDPGAFFMFEANFREDTYRIQIDRESSTQLRVQAWKLDEDRNEFAPDRTMRNLVIASLDALQLKQQDFDDSSIIHGGIDFARDQFDLQIKRDANGMLLPFELQDLEGISIQSLTPVIINFTIVTNLPMLLGYNINEDDSDSESAELLSDEIKQISYLN